MLDFISKCGAADYAGKIACANFQQIETRLSLVEAAVSITTFNVRTYGARGDGITDDSAAILTTITAAKILGGAVYFPFGVYRCAAIVSFVLTSGTTLVLYGDGPGSVIRIEGTTDTFAFTHVDGNGALVIRDLVITGAFSQAVRITRSIRCDGRVRLFKLDISGATKNPSAGPLAGVYCDGVGYVGAGGVDDLEIDGVYVHGCGDATYATAGSAGILLYTTNTARARLLNNRVDGGGLLNFGMGAFNTSGSLWQSNTVEHIGCTPLADAEGYGIYIYKTAGVGAIADKARLVNNEITDTGGTGIYLQSIGHTTVEGNVLEDVAKVQSDLSLPVGGIGCNISGTLVAIGNIIKKSGKSGIQLSGPKSIIAHNMLEDITKWGINLEDAADGTIIEANEIYRSGTGPIGAQGISVYTGVTATNLRIVDNVISGMNYGIVSDAGPVDSKITGNKIAAPIAKGISLTNIAAARNTIKHNHLNNCDGDWGIDVRGTENDISSNVISTSTFGIFEAGLANRIEKNDLVGVTAGNEISSAGTATFRNGNRMTTGALAGTVIIGSGGAGTALFLTTEIQVGDIVRISRLATGGTLGNLSVGVITPGVSVAINSDNAADTSTVYVEITH